MRGRPRRPRREGARLSSRSKDSTGTHCRPPKSPIFSRPTPNRASTCFDVEHRRAQFGPNALTPPKGPGALRRLLQQFLDPLVLILIAAGVVTIVLGDWVDAGVIFGVVLLNALVGYFQEAKAVAAIDALTRSMTTEAMVMRAGEQLRLPAVDIVPGDLILLQAGDKVPADLRLLRTRELRVDESALTGESVPVEKPAELVPRDCPLAERGDMAFASSLVTYGTGAGIAVATGDATEVGMISQLIAEARDLKTPLTRKIDQFSTVLLVIIVALALVTFGVGLLRGESLVDMFKASIALAVAAIPEGLPAAVTITLAIGVSRMAKRRAVIRKLPAVETLGSHHGHLHRQDRHADAERDDGAVRRRRRRARGERRGIRAGGRDHARRRVRPLRRCCAPACSATTRPSCRTRAAGRWPATPRRPPSSPPPPRAA